MSLPARRRPRHFLDVTLRLELGDLFLQGRDLGQIGTLLAIAGERRGLRRRRYTHPPPQNTLYQLEIPACMGHRHAPLGYDLIFVSTEPAAGHRDIPCTQRDGQCLLMGSVPFGEGIRQPAHDQL